MMKWDYLYDESKKTLTPFFSEAIISYHFGCLLITGMVLLVLWPRQPFYHFLEASQAPLSFFHVFVAATILCSYLSLRCGRGEMAHKSYFSEYYKDPPTFEKERNFFTYGLVEFLLHTAFLVLPFLPILIIATTVSWVPFAGFAKAVIVLYVSSLLCRLAGFVLYLLGGRLSYSGYFMARVFIIFYLFATAMFYSRINPLNILYGLNKGVRSAGNSLGSAFGHYMVLTGIALWGLIFICHHLIKRYNHRIEEA